MTVSVHVYVDDVDGHYERAKAAGGTITREIDDRRDYGNRRYHAVDPGALLDVCNHRPRTNIRVGSNTREKLATGGFKARRRRSC